MPLVSSTIPNLVGGISQQPAALRLTTACTEMINAWPSVVSGLQKRPPTRHIANIGSAYSSGAAGYLIERNENYRYLAVMLNGDLKVLNLADGSSQTVTFPDGKSYLTAASPVDAFRFVTFGDYTFIANRNISVTTSAVTETTLSATQTRLNPANMGTVYVTTSIYNTYYSVYVNGVLKASYLTPTGASGSAACPDTSAIATQLDTQLQAAGYTTLKVGSTVTITNLPTGASMSSQGGNGDKSVRVFIRDVQSFSDLPPVCPEGRIVRVAGDLTLHGDDYYVVFQKGVWVETLDYGTGLKYDAATMPHVLVRNSDGTWTFKNHVWDNRGVGDDDSNPPSSFAGTTIGDIFVFSNRMGILADENIILSEVDQYENFWRTTTAQLIDSDRIDLAVLHANVDVLNHAVAYNRDLLLMSSQNQFRFSYNQYLGQKTASIQFSTSFNVSTRIHPLNVGNSVYFVDDRADYQFTKMYEFFPKDNSTQDDADEVSSPIPELIPNDIIFSASSNRAKAVVAYSSQTPDYFYLYKFFWAGDRKAQSAWTKWQFPEVQKIYWSGFSGTYMYMLIERPYGVCLERMRFDEDVFDTDLNYEVLLDRRYSIVSGDMVYSSVNDYTTITLPYSTTQTPEVISSNVGTASFGIRQTVTKVNANTIRVPGNITGSTNVTGIPYTMTYEFSTFFPKQQKGQGEVIMQDGRTQLRYLNLEYHNTAYFTTRVITPGRDDAYSVFSGIILGADNSTLGKQPFASGKYRIPIMAENLKARIQIINDSPYPSGFGSAEWQGVMSPKSVQRL